MNKSLNIENKIISQSIKEYHALSLYRPEDKDYMNKKKMEGLTLCYLYDNGELNPWQGEEILQFFNDVPINIKDDTFKSKYKKMRVAKRAPMHWKFYYTNERIVATIPYGKTQKIGDIVDLFRTTIKRRTHKNHYVAGFFPHSMLAGIVLRSRKDQQLTKHIAFVYKYKLPKEDKIVNYTLFFFNNGTQKKSEKLCLNIKNLACNLQLKLLPVAKNYGLLKEEEIKKLKSKILENLKNNNFITSISTEKFKQYSIQTLYVGGIPFPLFPREHI